MSIGPNVKDDSDLSNKATKTDLQNATGVDKSDFGKKTGLAHSQSDVDKVDIDRIKSMPSNLNNLKTKVDKLDIGKLKTTPADLCKLSKLVKKDNVVKKAKYNELVKKASNIRTTDISNLVKYLIVTKKLVKLKIK